MLLLVFCIKLHISQRHPIHRAHIPGINQRLYLALYAVKGQQRDIRMQHAGFLIEPARQQKRIRVENIRRGAAPFFQPVILIANRLDAKRAMHASHIGNAVENLMEFQVIVSLLADRLSGRLVKGTVEHGCVHQIQRIAWKQRRNLRLGNIRRLAQKQRVIVRIGRAQLIIRQQMRIPAHFHLTINIGFVVIDEAHHAGLAKGGDRSAYLDMPDILKVLGNTVVLAATATATAPVVAELARMLPITRTVVDETVRENLQLEDDRDLASRENRLVSIVATGEKTVIYVNSRDQSVALAKTLRKRVPDCATHIAFYNAGLARSDRRRVEEAFRDGSLSCIVSTSAFGEGVNLPDIRHVVLYHMPFGGIEFNQMSGRAGRDGQPAVIHLLYSSRDARINERLLDCYAPERDELVTLYRALQTMWRSNRGKTGDDSFCASDIDIAQMCLAIDARTPVDERSVESGLGIFEELGFCRVSGFDDTRRIAMAENPGRVQLSRSIRYLEGLRSRMEFSAFRSWALDSCASDMLAKVNRPIVPRA